MMNKGKRFAGVQRNLPHRVGFQTIKEERNMNGFRGLVCAALLGAMAFGATPAPAAQSFFGYSGLLVTPTTEVQSTPSFSLGANFLSADGGSDAVVVAGEAGVYPDLELGLAVVKPEDHDSDARFNAKYRFLGETATRPAIAAGVFGLAGDADETLYVVFGKSFEPPAAGGIASPRLYVGFAGGGMDGVFGGFSLVLANRFTLMLEHDTNDFNFGARLSLAKQLRLQAGAFGGDAFGVGLSFYSSY